MNALRARRPGERGSFSLEAVLLVAPVMLIASFAAAAGEAESIRGYGNAAVVAAARQVSLSRTGNATKLTQLGQDIALPMMKEGGVTCGADTVKVKPDAVYKVAGAQGYVTVSLDCPVTLHVVGLIPIVVEVKTSFVSVVDTYRAPNLSGP